MRVLATSLVAVALLAPAATPVFAHGGQFRVPAGEVPPDSRQPEDPPPPDGKGGTPTPPDTGGGTPTPPPGGNGTPTPPPDNGGTPTPPGSGTGPVPPPSGPSGPGGTASGRSGRHGLSFDSWQYWWNHNKDEFLARRRDRAGESGGSGFSPMEDGGVANVGDRQDVTARAIAVRVVPLLEKYAVDAEADPDIRASALIGLARIGRRDRLPLLMQLARSGGEGKGPGIVEESAALSIGILGDRSPAVRKFLAELAADRSVRVRTRCFAAFSLGLLGSPDGSPVSDPASLEALRALVGDPSEASREIAASALTAMGHLGDPAALPDLLEWLKTGTAGAHRLDDLQLSCAAAAVGRIGRPAATGPGYAELVGALCDQVRRKNRLTRYSAVIALGQIGSVADEATRRACVSVLGDVAASEGRAGMDAQSVHFALVALGRISAASPEAVRAPAVARLRRTLEGKTTAARSFAALGLAVAFRDQPDAQRIDAADAVRGILARATGDVESRGALCIAAGLLRDARSRELLEGIVADKGDGRLRAAAVLSVGLVGDPVSVGVVRAALLEKQDKVVRVEASVAAGLLRDPMAVGLLVGILEDPKSSQFSLGSAATALGRIGDQRAVEPLARILDDAGCPALTRALACVALGQIGDRGDVPVLARMSKDVNYRAYYDAIGELLTIL